MVVSFEACEISFLTTSQTLQICEITIDRNIFYYRMLWTGLTHQISVTVIMESQETPFPNRKQTFYVTPVFLRSLDNRLYSMFTRDLYTR